MKIFIILKFISSMGMALEEVERLISNLKREEKAEILKRITEELKNSSANNNSTSNDNATDQEEFPIQLPPTKELYEKYDQQFIAISEQKIYATSTDFDEIHRLAEKRIPKEKMYTVEFIQNGVFIYAIGF